MATRRLEVDGLGLSDGFLNFIQGKILKEVYDAPNNRWVIAISPEHVYDALHFKEVRVVCGD